MSKYKLCIDDTFGKTIVQPINENGEEYGEPLMTLEGDGTCSYSIYINYGDDQDEDWEEYDFYDNFEDALAEYKKLKEEEQNE